MNVYNFAHGMNFHVCDDDHKYEHGALEEIVWF